MMPRLKDSLMSNMGLTGGDPKGNIWFTLMGHMGPDDIVCGVDLISEGVMRLVGAY